MNGQTRVLYFTIIEGENKCRFCTHCGQSPDRVVKKTILKN